MRFALRLSSVRLSTRYFFVAVALSIVGVVLHGRALGHGALHERIERLRTSLLAQPEEARLHLELADVFVQHQDWFYAIAHLDRVDALEPGEFDTRLLRGQALVGAGRMADARSVLDDFLKSEPRHPVALTARARALAELGEDEACLADYRGAVAATSNPEPDLFREIAEALVKRGREPEAVELLQGGLAKLGPVPALLTAAMQLEVATGRFDEALLRVEAMRQSAPRPEPWMAKRAAILAQAGRAEEARAAWRALIDHLAVLPNLERGAQPMRLLAEQAHDGLRKLSADSSSPSTTRP